MFEKTLTLFLINMNTTFLKKLFAISILLFSIQINAQVSTETNKEPSTQDVFRINLINPGVEYEMSVGKNSTFSIGTGLQVFAGSNSVDGSWYKIYPFIDTQYKYFYNFNRRVLKGKTTENNSGDFVSMRLLSFSNPIIGTGVDINQAFDRFMFFLGPTWGIQRKYGKSFHLLFDVGPSLYFDNKGKTGISYFTLQLNVGFDL